MSKETIVFLADRGAASKLEGALDEWAEACQTKWQERVAGQEYAVWTTKSDTILLEATIIAEGFHPVLLAELDGENVEAGIGRTKINKDVEQGVFAELGRERVVNCLGEGDIEALGCEVGIVTYL